MARPKNPNSQRTLTEKKREAERKAKEQAEYAAQIEAELKAKQASESELEKRLAEMEAIMAREKEKAEAEKQRMEMLLAEAEAKRIEMLEADPEIESKGEGMNDEEEPELLALLNNTLTKEKHPEQSHEEKKPEATESALAESDFAEFDFDGDFDEQPEIIKESETPGKVFAGIPPDEFSDMLVDGFDGLMQWFAPHSYKQMAFSKGEMKRLREIQQQAKVKSKKELVLENDDYDLLGRMEEFLEYQKTVPLTAREKKSLKIPLKVMLQQKGGDIPPGWALVYAATTIALPRFAPHTAILLAKQFSKYQTPFQNEQQTDENGTDDGAE